MSTHVWNVPSEEPPYGDIHNHHQPSVESATAFWVLSLQDSPAKVSAHEISTYSGTLITTKVNDRHENNNFFNSQIAKGRRSDDKRQIWGEYFSKINESWPKKHIL